MKNIHSSLFILLCFTVFTSETCKAQKLFCSLNGGYFGDFLAQSMGANVNEKSQDVYEVSLVKASFGRGVSYGFGIGGMLGKHLGAEVNFGQVSCRNINYKQTYLDGSYEKNNISAKSWRITPSLLISGNEGKVSPYARLGVIISGGSFTINDDYYDGFDRSQMTTVYKMKTGLGFGAAAGATIRLHKSLSLFGECSLSALNLYTKSSKTTKILENGQDVTGNYTKADKETVYYKSYTEDNNVPSSDNEPSKSLSQAIVYSNLGFNLGVRINLSGSI